MLRGEFVRGDGLILPNNITSRGAERILSRAFTNKDTQDSAFDSSTDIGNYIALGRGVYAPTVQLGDLGEPTIGVGGYARIAVPRGPGWRLQEQLNGEWYCETNSFTFVPTGAGYDKPVSRLILMGLVATSGNPWAVSSPFDELTMKADTPAALRTFRYRVYLR